MEDPFQCRLSFTKLLSRLNASTGAARQCATYALRNKELEEDLFSVILEQLQSEECTMNTRVNMLYFIELLCEQSLKSEYYGYTTLIKRDLVQIVDTVVPNNTEGAANVGTVRKVVQNLKDKAIIDGEALEEVVAMLAQREEEHKAAIASPPESIYDDNEEDPNDKAFKRKFDNKIIEQRMEEDRERHKRLRENIWAIPFPETDGSGGGGGRNPEFDKAWEETSELCEDDFEIMREENAILAASIL